eukprot:237260-Prymnesium_polylepis.1
MCIRDSPRTHPLPIPFTQRFLHTRCCARRRRVARAGRDDQAGNAPQPDADRQGAAGRRQRQDVRGGPCP